MSAPLGFNNTYALGMKEAEAERAGHPAHLRPARAPGAALGFSNEFMDRADGWPGLRDRYGLPQQEVRGLRPRPGLPGPGERRHPGDRPVLHRRGDRRVRAARAGGRPAALPRVRRGAALPRGLGRGDRGLARSLLRLEGRISEPEMVALNARAKLERIPEAQVAAEFLARSWALRVGDADGQPGRAGVAAHARAPVPRARVAARRRSSWRCRWACSRAAGAPGAGRAGAAGVLQTVPSLALLVLMIPLLGIGTRPAIVALFLYSLLPIVRNTHAGLAGIPRDCASPPRRWACRRAPAAGASSCRWRRRPSSPASRPPP